jgi:exopolysaccharide production protein ExoQ
MNAAGLAWGRLPRPGIRPLRRGRAVLCVIAAGVLCAIAAWLGLLVVVLALLLVGLAAGVAIVWPDALLFGYCAAIPFNFALPPGPAGTVARVAGIVFFLGYVIRDPGVLRPSSIPFAGWLYVGWSLMSVVWAIDAEVALNAWISLAQLFAITVVVSSIVTEKPAVVRPMLASYAVSATLTAIIAFVAFLQGGGMFSRATAFADQDPALFSSLLVPAIVALLGEVRSSDRGSILHLAALAALVICTAAVALSATRSAWLAVLVSTAAWLAFQRSGRHVLAVVTVTVAMLAILAAVPGAADFLAGRLVSSLTTGGSGRTDIWAVGLSILASNPITGAGFGNFGQAFSPYAIAASWVSTSGGALFADRGAHNVLLASAVETGVLGVTLLGTFMAFALTARGIGRWALMVRAALLGLLAQSFFLDILAQKQLWLFMAIAFGLAAAARRGQPLRVESPAERTAPPAAASP